MAGTGKAHLRPDQDPILVVDELVVEFPIGKGRVVHAVSGISLDVLERETLGIVGESGCGKSTTGRAIVQQPRPTSGKVILAGTDLASLDAEGLRRTRTQIQMILQDSVASLNPRRRIFDTVARGLRIWDDGDEASVRSRVNEVLEAVGLDPDSVARRRPHEFSGGQCQRICIARSLVLDPKVMVCDEPVSALDVSVQAQILNLLQDMKDRYRLTLLFISHDLGVIKNVSDRVAVMYLGKLCEVGASDALFASPAHHYTDLLLQSMPHPDPSLRADVGSADGPPIELPSPVTPPSGCRFRTRCPAATERCAAEEPSMRRVGDDHYVACHHPRVPHLDAAAESTT